jgi:hypothetical protein
MKQLCAATHESGSGTFRTCRDVRLESGMRTKADIPPMPPDMPPPNRLRRGRVIVRSRFMTGE